MLKLALVFFFLSIVTGLLVVTGLIAAGAAGSGITHPAAMLFDVFAILFVVFLLPVLFAARPVDSITAGAKSPP